jgi:hypothetical protein
VERKRRIRIGRLTTVGQVAAELGRLYRHARWGEVPVGDASRLATILALISQWQQCRCPPQQGPPRAPKLRRTFRLDDRISRAKGLALWRLAKRQHAEMLPLSRPVKQRHSGKKSWTNGKKQPMRLTWLA